MGFFEVIQRCASYAEGCRYLVRRPACASLLSLGKRTRLGVVVGIAGYIYTYAGGVIYSCSRKCFRADSRFLVCDVSKTYISPAGEAILEKSRARA
jgi:hypothetical protein